MMRAKTVWFLVLGAAALILIGAYGSAPRLSIDPNYPSVYVTVGAGGKVSVNGRPAYGGGFSMDMTLNQAVTLQAVPDDGYVFEKWSIGAYTTGATLTDYADNPHGFNIAANTRVLASFKAGSVTPPPPSTGGDWTKWLTDSLFLGIPNWVLIVAAVAIVLVVAKR
jgi:hypothetical protein